MAHKITLPSGLVEGSPEANAAEKAESERFEREVAAGRTPQGTPLAIARALRKVTR
jgi:hypothetical protein